MAKPRLKNNKGEFQKYTSVYITKELKAIAEDTAVNVRLVIADELEKKYKENVLASYTPRTTRGQDILKYNKSTGQGGHKKKLTYRHTGIFVNSIYTKIDGDRVKIMIKDEQYPEGASTEQVYKWLTEGTQGYARTGKTYPYIKKSGDRLVTKFSNTSAFI